MRRRDRWDDVTARTSSRSGSTCDVIDAFGITQHKLAVSIGVSLRRISEIVHGKRTITADTALRLGCYFGRAAVLD